MEQEIVTAIVKSDRYFTNPKTGDRSSPGGEVRVDRAIIDLAAGILVEKGSDEHKAMTEPQKPAARGKGKKEA